MCGRFQFSLTAEDPAISRMKELLAGDYPDFDWSADAEILPSQTVPALVHGGTKAQVRLMQWGYPSRSGSRLIINARSETAGERPMFRDDLQKRRCVLLTTGYYEWDRSAAPRQKYLLRRPGKAALYLAGLYGQYDGEDRFVILTTQANDSVSDLHDRMPLILAKSQVLSWLNDPAAARLLQQTPPKLEREPV